MSRLADTVHRLGSDAGRAGYDGVGGPTAKEMRMRLDKMVEAKTTIEPYESISKSGQYFKDFLEDLKEHVDHYDSSLANALDKVVSSNPFFEPAFQTVGGPASTRTIL